MRILPRLAAALLVIAGSLPSDADGRSGQGSGDGSGVIRSYHDSLALRLAASPGDADAQRQWSTFRHVEAMVDLVAQLPSDRRPRSLLYLAGGSHLAPLALCELLPAGEPCVLVSTDVDPAVATRIGRGLAELAGADRIADLEAGSSHWRFRLAGHPVELKLQPVPAGSVPDVDPAWLEHADLVITHDWSGDPLECLRVVYRVLVAARSAEPEHTPMLMLEDLERHPYPIDLGLLSPLARTTAPYGHRGSLPGQAGHGATEVGAPQFGGAVLLGLSDPWWRKVSPTTLRAVFDLLLFNEFGDQRRNVLEGGDDPLLAPAPLDWWTGFGVRTVAGEDLASLDDGLAAIARAAAGAAPAMEPADRQRLACRLQLLRTLAHALAAGADVEQLMPAGGLSRRPVPGRFPNPEMEAAHRDSLRHAGDYRADMEARVPQAARLAAALDGPELRDTLAECPSEGPNPGDVAAAGWAAAYRQLAASLHAR